MKPSLTLLFFLLIQLSFGQTTFNFNFEEEKDNRPINFPESFSKEYAISYDSTVKYEGKYAAKIQFVGGEKSFDAIHFFLPPNLEGKKIKVSAYVKTENVTEGYAGLWMRIDPNIGFDNMRKNGLKGTNDWQKLEIELDMYSDLATDYVVGALLVGKGTMWVDQFEVTVDGVPYDAVKKISYPADEDHRFDSGSKLTLENLTTTQLENLELLGKIWGFLKYHHPAIAAGKHQWDYALFAFLPGYLNCKSIEERNDLLFAWINQLGAFEQGKSYPKSNSKTVLYPDFSWIKQSNLNLKMIELLDEIKLAKREPKHYYLSLKKGEIIPTVKEKTYNVPYPDAGYRLLALFRYWSILEYFSPYKHLNNQPWSSMLKAYLPKFIDASDERNYVAVVKEFASETKDAHTSISGSNTALYFHGERCANLHVRTIENQAVVVGTYNDSLGNAGLIPGDILLSIGGKAMTTLTQEFTKEIAASNEATFHRDMNLDMLYSTDSSLLVQYKRGTEIYEAQIPTYRTNQLYLYSVYEGTNPSYKLLNPTTLYINIGSLKYPDLSSVDSLLKIIENLIIDSRNYPSDFILYALGELLLNKQIPFCNLSGTSLEFPGVFTLNKLHYVGKKKGTGFQGKIIVLVNEITQSSAEFHVMSFQAHPNTTVIGSTTAGADGNVVTINLPGGLTSRFSSIGVYYPDGSPTQQVGVHIDHFVTPTIDGILSGKDEVLEHALNLLQEK
jgi:hypothetical protein